MDETKVSLHFVTCVLSDFLALTVSNQTIVSFLGSDNGKCSIIRWETGSRYSYT
uniref:Uncharacterized protein n=1 Tax=Brassica oleracea TaxID=3712 RepID=A0A3P6E0V7_BRAOL|nr:unnamed protein product [Brassica oleracea]